MLSATHIFTAHPLRHIFRILEHKFWIIVYIYFYKTTPISSLLVYSTAYLSDNLICLKVGLSFCKVQSLAEHLLTPNVFGGLGNCYYAASYVISVRNHINLLCGLSLDNSLSTSFFSLYGLYVFRWSPICQSSGAFCQTSCQY